MKAWDNLDKVYRKAADLNLTASSADRDQSLFRSVSYDDLVLTLSNTRDLSLPSLGMVIIEAQRQMIADFQESVDLYFEVIRILTFEERFDRESNPEMYREDDLGNWSMQLRHLPTDDGCKIVSHKSYFSLIQGYEYVPRWDRLRLFFWGGE